MYLLVTRLGFRTSRTPASKNLSVCECKPYLEVQLEHVQGFCFGYCLVPILHSGSVTGISSTSNFILPSDYIMLFQNLKFVLDLLALLLFCQVFGLVSHIVILLLK